TLGEDIKLTKAHIATLEKYREVQKAIELKPLALVTPEATQNQFGKHGINSVFGVDWKAINKQIDETVQKMKGLKPPPEVVQQWLDFGSAISGAISTVADSFGQALAGVGNFGDSILKALAGFARQIGETLIGIGVAMIAARKAISNPYTAIAAGVALVALAGALSASLSSAQRNFNNGGGSSSATENATRIKYAPIGQRIEVVGRIEGRGSSLIGVIETE